MRFHPHPDRLPVRNLQSNIASIDEVQKIPQMLDEVHGLIENKGLRFLLCGSSARKPKRGTIEKALEYIRAGAGTHFDPKLVELFLALLPAPKEMEGAG